MRTGRNIHTWDAESDAMLKRLFIDQGLSGSLCGQRMGLPRSAVIGRANRLGFKKGRRGVRSQLSGRGTEVVIRTFFWTPEKDEDLKKLCQSTAASWPRIGKALGCSATTVSKRAKSLGIEKKRAGPIRDVGVRVKGKRSKLKNPECLKSHKPNRKSTGKVGVLDLTRNMCRWPIGDPLSDDFSFCGDECTKGSSYCLEHTVNSVESLL